MAKIREPSRSAADHDRIKALVEGVDHVAGEMERKWGVDRLPRLVGDDFRQRFYSQARKFNAAVLDGGPADVQVEGERMTNAWKALDWQAEQAGHKAISPEVWEIPLSDGRVAALVRTREEQFALAHAGRRIDVYSLDEIGRLIEAFPDIAKVKQHFPGAQIINARVSAIDWDHGDDIPDLVAAG